MSSQTNTNDIDMEHPETNRDDSDVEQRQHQRQQLQDLRLANDRKWKHLQALLVAGIEVKNGSSTESSLTSNENGKEKTESIHHATSLDLLVQSELELLQNSPHSEWKNGIDDLLQKLQTPPPSAVAASYNDEEAMLQFDRDLLENYHELIEVKELTEQELKRQKDRLLLLQYQTEELQDLKVQLMAARMEQEQDRDTPMEVSSELQAHAINVDHKRLVE
jgi:hypothetical protein